MTNLLKTFGFLAILLVMLSCATSVDVNTEEARDALDVGDWGTAIAKARAVLDEEPANVNAALLLASGYAGRGGFKLLDMASIIANDVKKSDVFDKVRDDIGTRIVDVEDLSLAIDSLTIFLNPLPQSAHPYFVDHQYRAGMLMAIEAFVLVVVHAQPIQDGDINVDNITEADKAKIERDLQNADNYLVNAGLPEDDDLVQSIRENYCVLRNASTSATGFDTTALRDMVRCQLSPNDGEDLSRDNGDFESSIINTCSDFDYTACEEAGPTS